MYVEIGGIAQWIEIEGERADAPVLLLVHGGPGGSTRIANGAWKPWQQHFTLVHWDQRGSGRTFARNGAKGCSPMSFERIVADGIELAEFLFARQERERIFVLGHSWGAAVSVHMVARRPELFAGLALTGLPVDFQLNEDVGYARLVALAQEQGDVEALATLAEIGPPRYAGLTELGAIRALGDRLSQGKGDAPQPRPPARPIGITEEDRLAMAQGFAFSCETLIDDLWAIDLRALGTRFAVPMALLMGTHDQQTPCDLAEAWFREIEAPRKAAVRFEGCHHFVHFNRPDEFLAELVAHLLTVEAKDAYAHRNNPRNNPVTVHSFPPAAI